ncbi:polyprenyl synthetase family protein [Streptomyces sp. NPDC050439]|uniref:polyprenyl synthetase family protein n=1 Tax=unclassified Streptomyces TaxID=2593676 RepID=UPI00341A2822
MIPEIPEASAAPELLGDPALVDADVPAAVGRTLERVLAERLEAARRIDPAFAKDVAGRVAHFTSSGGKRLRPRFLWWGLRACAETLDADQIRAALRLCVGLELIQTCALVHDDVMDGSPLRRGRQAVHVELDARYGTSTSASTRTNTTARGAGASFGTSAAILVGDLALAWADDLVADTALDAGTARTVRALWQAMREEMVAGQYLDLHGQATGSRSLSRAARTATLKSALYSVERPLAFGAALAGTDGRTTRALCAAGRCAGLAFQLRDDLLGVYADSDHTGKPAGDDIREGKATYLMAVARERAEAGADHDSLAVLDAVLGGRAESTGLALDHVRGVLEATGARGIVENRVRRLAAQSVRHLADAALPRKAAEAQLRELFYLVSGVSGPLLAPTAAAAPVAAAAATATATAAREERNR